MHSSCIAFFTYCPAHFNPTCTTIKSLVLYPPTWVPDKLLNEAHSLRLLQTVPDKLLNEAHSLRLLQTVPDKLLNEAHSLRLLQTVPDKLLNEVHRLRLFQTIVSPLLSNLCYNQYSSSYPPEGQICCRRRHTACVFFKQLSRQL